MENSNTPYNHFLTEVNNHVKNAISSTKKLFNFKDSCEHKEYASPREKTLINAIEYLNSNPLRNNDYFKYLNAYIDHNVKLNLKYFKHDVAKLNEYYLKFDEKKSNPFSKVAFENYVLYMFLKLKGHYKNEEDDLIFMVQIKDNREYNPLAKIPSVLRGGLPFECKEYDIKRAFPTFIDIELGTDFRTDIYEKIDKKHFAVCLNSNSNSKITIEKARKGLEVIYNGRTKDVITEQRYNQKGRAFKDFTKYEEEYICKFIVANKLDNYARLHDGIFVLKDVECKVLIFDKVEFSIKENINPKVEKHIISYYKVSESGKIITSPSMYADFLKQENFTRITTPEDKIILLKNKNNIVDCFNHKTNMVSFLEGEINEGNDSDVRNKISSDNFSVLANSYHLLPSSELIYYKDGKTRFGLPFENGFFYFDKVADFEIKSKSYSDVKGFFSPHDVQTKTFTYTNNVGDFELFIQRVSTGVKDLDSNNIEQKTILDSFNSMIGYLCHNYKLQGETPIIILTDEGANDINRNGGRGKTIIAKSISKVQKQMFKGDKEFNPDYSFNYSDLDRSYPNYHIDDVEAGFDYNCLYTQATEGINCQKKGLKAEMIEFKDSPKFVITSNWLIRYDEKNTSTNRRFFEYKIKPYYNINFKPKDEFKETFFEEWNDLEWSKFYSYIFRCVHLYMKDGLKKIKYDKTEDNYKASFGSDVKESEMARIIDVLINHKKKSSFNVSDFLTIYLDSSNLLKNEKLFHKNNSKNKINIYLKHLSNNKYIYNDKTRRWGID